MDARSAVGSGWRTFRRNPAGAFATLIPLTPLALLSAASSAHISAAPGWFCSIASFALFGPALIGSYRLCLRLADGVHPRIADGMTGFRFFWPTLVLNVLRLLTAIVICVPMLVALVIYFLLSGSPMAQGAAPSVQDFTATLLLGSPAAIAVICIKCLTYLFEIQLADGAETGFWSCLDSSIRIAWRNIKPIAWIFTYLGLATLPLLGLAALAAPSLERFLAQPGATPAVTHLAAIELGLKILILPLLPWILLSLIHAYRQVRTAPTEAACRTSESPADS